MPELNQSHVDHVDQNRHLGNGNEGFTQPSSMKCSPARIDGPSLLEVFRALVVFRGPDVLMDRCRP